MRRDLQCSLERSSALLHCAVESFLCTSFCSIQKSSMLYCLTSTHEAVNQSLSFTGICLNEISSLCVFGREASWHTVTFAANFGKWMMKLASRKTSCTCRFVVISPRSRPSCTFLSFAYLQTWSGCGLMQYMIFGWRRTDLVTWTTF